MQEDESLRRWKEKLLGCLESELDGLFEDFVYHRCLWFMAFFICSVLVSCFSLLIISRASGS